ncbi:hypothetical protein CERSUDRAFT_75981 [Gelatoporia subvermispora B]|uniref:Uncharacterized protein n=1 Tax=Ceriporiopsis subvermispora (strain B) TaxID=914234 RepID=M2R7R2_CERS8|nr:hypothetical protein CERSUDRAFT_75981 [Gelatoporia subvermispora B]
MNITLVPMGLLSIIPGHHLSLHAAGIPTNVTGDWLTVATSCLCLLITYMGTEFAPDGYSSSPHEYENTLINNIDKQYLRRLGVIAHREHCKLKPVPALGLSVLAKKHQTKMQHFEIQATTKKLKTESKKKLRKFVLEHYSTPYNVH